MIRPAELPREPVTGLYVHVPFCFHKCHYCDFYSITRQGEDRMAVFVDRVLAEADMWSARNGGPQVTPATLFFGGGTPSLLPLPQMQRLIRGLWQRFDCSAVSEWTVEVNPATANLEYLQMLRSSGIDRISLGAQSFDRTELATLERHHDPDDVPRSLDLARQAGFSRLNIDLIYAIPGQSLESWSHSLDSAIRLDLSHYSCYGLTYEPNTPLAVRKRLGQIAAVDESIELQMLDLARRRLEAAGCPAYEISNYAQPAEECRHNLLYWTGGNYVGLGPSAASHLSGYRFKNRPHLGEWEQSIDSGDLPASEVEILTPRQRAGERVMLGLRLTRGLNFDDYAARSGFDARMIYAEQIDRLARVGLIACDDEGFRLTRAGINVADAVASEFLNSEE